MLRYVVSALGVVAVGAATILACSDALAPSERIATTSEALSLSPQTNYAVNVGSGRSETSIAVSSWSTTGSHPAPVGNWVVGWNGSQNCGSGCYEGAGWAYSSDLDASAWTTNEVLDFGTPTGADGGAVTMSDGYPFFHLRSDPGLAPVLSTPPDAGDYNRRILYTMLADSTHSYTQTLASDVAIAISDNGGQTWGHPKLVTDSSSASGGVDHPAIATQRTSPYTTVVAWVEAASPKNKMWFKVVSYSNDSNFTFNAGSAIQIDPNGTSGNPGELYVDIGEVPDCSGGANPALFISWVVGGPGRCNGSNSAANISWWFAAWDLGRGAWFGSPPWEIDSDTNWPACIGAAQDGGVSGNTTVATNDPSVRIAAHYNDPQVNVVYVKKGDGHGTRPYETWYTMTCNPNQPTNSGSWHSPNPCLGGCFSHCCDNQQGDNGPPIVTDEWGPAIAYVYNAGTSTDETVWTWYSNRSDKTNMDATMFGVYQGGSTVSNLVQIGLANTGDTVPWNYSLNQWWDYQGIQSDLVSLQFLNAWGGDGRNAPLDGGIGYYGTGGIYSAVIQ